MRSEFQFIQNLKDRYSLDKVGDDCAVLPRDTNHDLVVTADLLIEDVDFRLEWTTAEKLGHKALAVSLSDIAAMGAKPIWAMISLGVPENLWNSPFLNEFYGGWHALASRYGVELVGGDISGSPDSLVIDSIVGGIVPKGMAIRRYGARPGDAVFVSGTLGAAASGLKLLESGVRSATMTDQELILRQLQPVPRLDVSEVLAKIDAVTAMIDISDGLSSDLYHLCGASGVGAQLIAADIPLHPGLPWDSGEDLALNGGEDFELLFTLAPKDIDKLKDIDVTAIGSITGDAGVMELIRNGLIVKLEPKGFRHF